MRLFEKAFRKNYIRYHHRPIVPNSLDPRMFSFFDDGRDPALVALVRTQFLYDIQELNNTDSLGNMTRVADYVMVGPVLTKDSSPSCPVIILVQLNTTNLDDVLKERLENTAKRLSGSTDTSGGSGRLLPGTAHPVEYQLFTTAPDINSFDSVYHPFYDRWIKKPRFLGK